MGDILDLIIKSYGLIGVLILAPFLACVFLWKDNLKLNKEVRTTQNQRVTDAQSISSKFLEIIKEQSSLNAETNVVLNRINGVLERLHEDRWEKPRR